MLYLFDEYIDLENDRDRWKAHKIVDEVYYLAIVSVDGEDYIQYPEYINLDDLSFQNDLDIQDFDLIDVSVEEIKQENEELHRLISNKDENGLVKFSSSLPISFNRDTEVGMREILESGRLEELIEQYVDERYDSYYVEHSKSCVSSNSFYIKDENDEVVLKISDHNTTFQKLKHNTPFINPLGNYGIDLTLEQIYDRIDNVIR